MPEQGADVAGEGEPLLAADTRLGGFPAGAERIAIARLAAPPAARKGLIGRRIFGRSPFVFHFFPFLSPALWINSAVWPPRPP